MIQADRSLLERARRLAHDRGVSFPQLVRDALERELGAGERPVALTCAGVIATDGAARGREYEPDPWR